jgi:hypothetical protein
MSNFKMHANKDWTLKPARQLGRDAIAFLIMIITAVLAIHVHWAVGLGFLLVCLVASHFIGRPKKIRGGGL